MYFKAVARLLMIVAASSCASSPVAASQSEPTAMPPNDSPANIPASFTVSGNQPAWTATVDARRLVLEMGEGRRVLKITTNEPLFDGRYAVARDAQGEVEIRVTERLCQDALTGEALVYTGKLSIAGAKEIYGCGKPLAGK